MFLEEADYISLLDAREIRRKIEAYNLLDISLTSEEKIRSAILDIFCVTFNEKPNLVFYSYTLDWPANELFYRVRKDIDFLKKPCEEDFWDNPKAPRNRFNKEGERVLYTSVNIGTALEETGVKQNQDFVLIEYSNNQTLTLSPSEVINRYGDENKNDEALNLLNEFICRITKIPVGDNVRYLYKATNTVGDILNLLPRNEEEVRDGMLYISTHTEIMSNLAIKHSAIRKLIIKNIWIARMNEFGDIGFASNIFIENGIVRLEKFQKSSVAHLPMLP